MPTEGIGHFQAHSWPWHWASFPRATQASWKLKKKPSTKVKKPNPNHTPFPGAREDSGQSICLHPQMFVYARAEGNRGGTFLMVFHFLFHFNSCLVLGASQDAGMKIRKKRKKIGKKGGQAGTTTLDEGLEFRETHLEPPEPPAAGAGLWGIPTRRHCWGCGTQDPSQLSELTKPVEGLAQGFQPFRQLLGQSLCMGKPEMNFKTS